MEDLKQLPPELVALVQVVEGLQATLGRTGEVVLHDFRNPDHSIVAIAGQVTGRQVGGPLTERLLEVYRTYGDDAPNLLNLKTRTKSGRLLRSSTLFVRDKQGKIIGSLGINLDLSEYEMAARVMNDLLGFSEESQEQAIDFAADVGDVMRNLIEAGLNQMGHPPQLLSREERVSLVRMLETRGLFLIKGAVEEVASRLGVSRFTVYGYLDEVRKDDAEKEPVPEP